MLLQNEPLLNFLIVSLTATSVTGLVFLTGNRQSRKYKKRIAELEKEKKQCNSEIRQLEELLLKHNSYADTGTPIIVLPATPQKQVSQLSV